MWNKVKFFTFSCGDSFSSVSEHALQEAIDQWLNENPCAVVKDVNIGGTENTLVVSVTYSHSPRAIRSTVS